jgi:hypothetical protein
MGLYLFRAIGKFHIVEAFAIEVKFLLLWDLAFNMYRDWHWSIRVIHQKILNDLSDVVHIDWHEAALEASTATATAEPAWFDGASWAAAAQDPEEDRGTRNVYTARTRRVHPQIGHTDCNKYLIGLAIDESWLDITIIPNTRHGFLRTVNQNLG